MRNEESRANETIGFKWEIVSDNVITCDPQGFCFRNIGKRNERDRREGRARRGGVEPPPGPVSSVRLNRNVFVAQRFQHRLGQYFRRRDGAVRVGMLSIRMFYCSKAERRNDN